MLRILASRDGRSIPELMQETGCSRRTVWRDLEVLQAVGFPLSSQRDGRENRYRLMHGPRDLPPIPFTLTEVMALHLGRHLLVPLRGTPVGAPIHTALEKIAATLAPGAKDFLERFRHVRPTGDTFEVPAAFDLERYLAGSFGLFRGRPVPVVLRFSRAVARYVAERQWHMTQVTAPLLTGELDLSLRVPLSPELTRWILSYGKDVEVREPATLREEIRREWLAALRGVGGRAESQELVPRRGARPYRLRTEATLPTSGSGRNPSRRPTARPQAKR